MNNKGKILFLIIVVLSIYFKSCCSSTDTTPLIKLENGKLIKTEIEKGKPYKTISHNIQKLPQSFEIMSWNGLAGYRKIFKRITGLRFEAFECNSEKWDKIFYELSRGKDLVLIQEAYFDKKFLNIIEKFEKKYSVNMARSFITDDIVPNGVLTISTADAESVYPMLTCEPFLPTPKSTLFTTFGFENNDDVKLLVVNIHAILMGSKNFINQLQNIKDIIDKHDGPVILAGDFNTMTESRTNELSVFTQGSKKLNEVKFYDGNDKRIKINNFPIDFIFYRGLTPIGAIVIDLKNDTDCKVSDHNPIIAKFTLKGENANLLRSSGLIPRRLRRR